MANGGARAHAASAFYIANCIGHLYSAILNAHCFNICADISPLRQVRGNAITRNNDSPIAIYRESWRKEQQTVLQ